MRVRHSIAAGLADSALASVATFLIGLYATRQLSLAALGVYGLAFSAFILAASVPALLIFVPAEIALLRSPVHRQMGAVPATVRLGLLPAVVAAALAFSVVGLVERDAPGVVAMATGGFLAAVVSPLQDHLRRLLHQVNRNFAAAAISLAQLSAAALAVLGMSRAGVAKEWIPFLALAVANIVSGALGMLLVRRGWDRPNWRAFRLGHLTGVGGWLLLAGSIEMAAVFIALALLSAEAGSEAVGQYEATRVLSQPLFVLAGGLLSVLNPRVMRASQNRDRSDARRVTAVFMGVFGVCGLGYLLVAGTQWPGNPLVSAFPNAYVTRGLLAAMITMQIIVYGAQAFRSQVLAAGGERRLATVNSITAVTSVVLVGGLAAWLGAFAVPMAQVTVAIVGAGIYVRLLRDWYAGVDVAWTSATPDEVA